MPRPPARDLKVGSTLPIGFIPTTTRRARHFIRSQTLMTDPAGERSVRGICAVHLVGDFGLQGFEKLRQVARWNLGVTDQRVKMRGYRIDAVMITESQIVLPQINDGQKWSENCDRR